MTVGQKDGKVTITVDVPGVEKVHWQTLGNQVFIRSVPRCHPSPLSHTRLTD
jgi:HSP20 family molecular chaperone IbpA